VFLKLKTSLGKSGFVFLKLTHIFFKYCRVGFKKAKLKEKIIKKITTLTKGKNRNAIST